MGARPSSIARNKQTDLPQEHLFDTHPEVGLDFEIVRRAAREKYTRPFLILDTGIVRDKARRFRASMPRVRPHYAVKANPDRRVLKVVAQEGVGFEIASTDELDLLISLGVSAAEVFYSNPVKSRDAIAYAAGKGVEWFVVDSIEEVRRVYEVKPDAKQYLRIATPNIGSDWPLSGKFGAGVADRRGSRRGHVSRRIAMPQPRKLARRDREGACGIRRDAQGRPQAQVARHRRRFPCSAREAHPVDRGHRRGGERGAQGNSGGGHRHRRAGPLHGFGCRLLR